MGCRNCVYSCVYAALLAAMAMDAWSVHNGMEQQPFD